jgi:hypothetical protein
VVAWLCDLVTWMAFDFLISQDIVVFLQCFTQLLTVLLYLIQSKSDIAINITFVHWFLLILENKIRLRMYHLVVLGFVKLASLSTCIH